MSGSTDPRSPDYIYTHLDDLSDEELYELQMLLESELDDLPLNFYTRKSYNELAEIKRRLRCSSFRSSVWKNH